jgi:riboflavin kinase/FMN adenylyltransferase
MLSLSSVSEVPPELGETAVTIGKFDGIHLGHQALLAETLAIAEEQMIVPAVITFDRHPVSVLNPVEQTAPLIGPTQKLELIEQAGIELVLTLTFDEDLSQLSPRDFVQEILVNGLSSKAVVVGEDFKFGAGQGGDIGSLRELGAEFGFVVKVVPSVEVEGQRVSTTLIRKLLLEGSVKEAAKLLGRLHATRGEVEHGLKIGRELGFPTANISRSAEGFLPKDGVYAGWLYDAHGEKYPAALSIGINETFTAVPRLLEAHVIDVNGLDLYEKVTTVEYVEFIRDAAKFNGVEDLVAEINRDLDKIRAILS